jgi:hypothetical protein
MPQRWTFPHIWRRLRRRVRLTGISTPLGGISFTSEAPERETVRRFLIFCEDRYIFSLNECPAEFPEVLRMLSSINKVSNEATKVLQMLPESSPAVSPLRSLRFGVGRSHGLGTQSEIASWFHIFKDQAGAEFAALATSYDLHLHKPLRTLAPADDPAVLPGGKPPDTDRALTRGD